jgi:hypothetical protein
MRSVVAQTYEGYTHNKHQVDYFKDLHFATDSDFGPKGDLAKSWSAFGDKISVQPDYCVRYSCGALYK